MPIDNPYPSVRGPLLTSLTTLAASPEYLSTIEYQLASIARLATERVAAADFASITGMHDPTHVTVTVSGELIRAIDEILHDGRPRPVFEDIGGTVSWPGFHLQASRLGLTASLTVPLLTGCGRPVAALHVYGRDSTAMAPLIAGVCTARGLVLDGAPELTDQGGQELVAGYAEALAVRARIHRALAVIMREDKGSADDAYVTLCIHAAHSGIDLAAAASSFLSAG
jgi:hypothetical protein